MDDIERTLLVKPEVFVYKIPPRPSARGYRAADWNLTAPDWTGRLRCVVKGKACELRLEDKSSGELFGACPVETYPGMAVEAVTDSSRYFVICLQDSGRKAFIGIGFADRSDSFDLNVALQDHFKWLKKEDAFAKEAVEPDKPNLDLAFKAGQTIRINIPKKDSAIGPNKQSNKALGSAGGAFLPPPPGMSSSTGSRPSFPAPGSANLTPLQSPSDGQAKPIIGGNSNVDLLGDLLGGNPQPQQQQQQQPSSDDPWGDFASAPDAQSASSGNWVQF